MTLPLWTSDSAATATGGEAHAEWAAHGVSIDSRAVEKDDLFVAIDGPNFDGHEFVANALESGAAAALISRQPPDLAETAPSLVVNNTLDALRALAMAARSRTNARIIAVTGSVGKTGTKDSLYAALAQQGATSASVKSFNNHWGVPLSLARMPADGDFGIFEVGMNHAGEIAPLSRMIKPHVAIITTVEAAHIEFFDSVEAIADAKAEIFEGMDGGTAILNRDNALFDRLAKAARSSRVDRIVTFGEHVEADVRMISYAAVGNCGSIKAEIIGQAIDYRTGAPGKHLAMNSLAMLAAVWEVNADVAAAARSLQEQTPGVGRGERHTIALPKGVFTLIDESYNANPASMLAAIETLGATEPGPDGRRIAVLGDMRELGQTSIGFHQAVAAQLLANNIDITFACGANMAAMMENLPAENLGAYEQDAAALARHMVTFVQPGDVIVVKGSLAIGMSTVVETLLSVDANNSTAARG
jgi:UDP-N-acetylmuramoyl-tripeptide--D-alanyl-D-alanine ligase